MSSKFQEKYTKIHTTTQDENLQGSTTTTMSKPNDGRKGDADGDTDRGRSRERRRTETRSQKEKTGSTTPVDTGKSGKKTDKTKGKSTMGATSPKTRKMQRESPDKSPRKSATRPLSKSKKTSTKTTNKDRTGRKLTPAKNANTFSFASLASGAVDLLLGNPTESIKVKDEVMEHNRQVYERAKEDREQIMSVKDTDVTMEEITENEKHSTDKNSNETQENVNQQKQQEAREHTPTTHTTVTEPYQKDAKTMDITLVQREKPQMQINTNESNKEEAEQSETDASTPKTNGAKPTYASASQTMIKTHTQIKHQHNMFAEITFDVDRNCQDIPPPITNAIVREVIINVLKRGKHVDHQVAINPYYKGTNLPSIRKPEDVPVSTLALKAYIPHQYQRITRLRQGKNKGFRMNLTFTIPTPEFIHLWEQSKQELSRVPFIQLKKTPMQDSETYHTIGYFINSSEKQCMEQTREALAKEANTKIGLDFRQAAMDKNTLDTFWKDAKQKAGGNTREMFKRAPMVMQAYAETKNKAREAAAKFYASYGRQINGNYPRMPDGSRMKFVPAAHFIDMKSRKTARDLMNRQIWSQSNTVYAPIPITNPYQRFESQGNKTMNELLLDLQCETKDEEPYFRHINKKWTREYDPHKYEVAIHSKMYTEAAGILRNLREVLTKTYGKEVADAIGNMNEEEEDELGSTHTMSVITLDTEDRYINGKGRFIFEGLEQINQTPEAVEPSDERSMHVRSDVSGLEDHRTIATNSTNGSPSKDNTHAVDRNIAATGQHVATTAQNEFTRVGTQEDAERLRQRVLHASHDPGDGQRVRYP